LLADGDGAALGGHGDPGPLADGTLDRATALVAFELERRAEVVGDFAAVGDGGEFEGAGGGQGE